MKDNFGFFSITRFNRGRPGWKNLAFFHTHPFTGLRPDGEKWSTKPDCEVSADLSNPNFSNIVNMIQAPDGVRYYYGG